MLLNCCLLYRGIFLPRHAIFCIFVSMVMSRSILSSFCDLFFQHFIFITINDIISLTQANLFIGHVCQKFSLRVLLNFYLTFCQFQPGVAYKSVAYKKKHVPNIKFLE